MDSLDRLPTVRIGGLDYAIVIDEDLLKCHDLLGTIDLASCEIRIDASLPAQSADSTILHEAVYGILSQSGHDSEDDAKDEALVTALAHGFHAFLRDNVEFVCGVIGVQLSNNPDGRIPEDAA